jgi:AcrR family transcriptional regulator
MTGRPRSVSDDEIFGGVATVVGRAGPAGLTLAAVGTEVGLSAPALAQRFGSKRGLLLAFAANGEGAVRDVFDEAERRSRSPVRALHLAVELLIAPVDTREALAHSIAFLQMDLTDPDLRAHAVVQSRELRRRIRRLLEAASAAGELTGADLDGLDGLTQAVYTTYNGALLTWAIDGSGSLARWMRRSLDATLATYRSH